ncbi:putative sulfate permease C3H7.02 [Pseudocercospora fuligena]|uniref:Putative sulfate permease C3H7.02 n=1 Tax=Pseudocercospora fuligena TaxID=685502 RepID=A0A8H6RKG3_9PEZI|nr:putative sulfate permease C3H7.02 [Pseudocercospora fuligena]
MNRITGRVKEDFKTDYNWNRAARLSAKGARALPSASLHYVTEKFPIIGWLPRYDWRWLINDLIAGLTVGLMLIPQSLSYAKIATIPVEAGLASSWLPATLYAFLGTTKDLSTGPTSLIGLLTQEQVEHFAPDDGSGMYTPTQVASALAMWMGIFGLILGMLNLGFLLDFISLPILSGFISAVAITIILGQIPSLLGEDSGGDSTAEKIHDVFANLPSANGYACAIGFTGLLFLTVIERVGKRYSDKSKVIWFLTITRAFLALVLFTGISYGVNKKYGDDDDSYLWGVAKVQASGIAAPAMPPADLISKMAPRSIAIFIGSAIEHVAIARAFGVKNNYITDQTQELAYYGITNFFNSFFHTMGVGGAMSRTAVNSACKVKSPLSGIFTTAVVLVCVFKLSSALYWIPKATLAAIIISAVWPLISSPKVFYTYWKTSLADFISSMIAFWVCLFVSTEIGIASAVGFNIAYILLRQVFTRVSHAGTDTALETQSHLLANSASTVTTVPDGFRIFRLNESFLFSNAYRVATSMTDAIQTHHAPNYSLANGSEKERNWSVAGERRIARLRARAHITDPSALPPIRVVVLDFSKCNHIDSTAVTQLRNFLAELKKYGGASVQARFCGMSTYVQERFQRAGFLLVMDEEGGFNAANAKDGAIAVRVYVTVSQAVMARIVENDGYEAWDEKEKVVENATEVEEKK